MPESSEILPSTTEKLSIKEIDLETATIEIEKRESQLSGGKKRALKRAAPLLLGASLFLIACQATAPAVEVETIQRPTPTVIRLEKTVIAPTVLPPSPTPIPEPQTTTSDEAAWRSFIPIEKDSLGEELFREFLGNAERIVRAWTVEGSIYRPWFDLQTLQSAKYAPDNFLPRWSQYEQRSNLLLDTPQVIQELGRDNTAIILDSGGQHSIAMAYELAKDGGWQPVPMLQEIPCSHCSFRSADELIAVALYCAAEMETITTRLPQEAPPVFIWNAHRVSLPLTGEIDNSYSYELSDMPSPEFLRQNGISKILYINEGRNTTISPWQDQGYDSDWAEILRNYQSAGLEIYSLGIPPK